jgi:hypothetical protein
MRNLRDAEAAKRARSIDMEARRRGMFVGTLWPVFDDLACLIALW